MSDLSSNPDSHEQANATQRDASLWKPRRIIAQLLGFAVGAALLGWCIHNAVRSGDWSSLRDTNPVYIVGLAGCSLVSLLVNGAVFWLMIRPVQPLRFSDLQLLNLTTAVLNYAPIRLGLIARIAYHLRVDRMSLLRMGAWLGAVAYTMLLCLGAVLVATLLRPHFDAMWVALLAGQLILAGLLTRAMLGQAIIQRSARGMEQMLLNHRQLWGGLALRLIDIAAFVGRMAFAVAIVPDLALGASDVVLLAITALALSLNPLGRFGFREAGVAIVAEMLVSSSMSIGEVEGRVAQLGLIESAGEAIVFIPLGVLSLIWYRRQWKAAALSRNADG